MTTLSPAERTRLVGILGMLGSEHAGERASAALLAAKLVRDHGLSWSDVVPSPAGSVISNVSRGVAEPISDLGLCLRHVDQLTQWEQGFVRSLAGRRNRTIKQTAMLSRLCEALRSRGLG